MRALRALAASSRGREAAAASGGVGVRVRVCVWGCTRVCWESAAHWGLEKEGFLRGGTQTWSLRTRIAPPASPELCSKITHC